MQLGLSGKQSCLSGIHQAEKQRRKKQDFPCDVREYSGQHNTFSTDRKKAQQAIAYAFEEMLRLEQLMSMFREESQLSQINRSAGLRPLKVDHEMLEVVDLGLQLSRETEGAFNMAIGSAMRHWDFFDKKRIPTPEEIQSLSRSTRFEDVILERAEGTVFLKKAGMQLDPGGIGKGYIAERAKTLLLESGITSGLIALAGDLVLFGTKADEVPWRVGVQHPRRKGEIVASLDLTDCAISTSAASYNLNLCHLSGAMRCFEGRLSSLDCFRMIQSLLWRSLAHSSKNTR